MTFHKVLPEQRQKLKLPTPTVSTLVGVDKKYTLKKLNDTFNQFTQIVLETSLEISVKISFRYCFFKHFLHIF